MENWSEKNLNLVISELRAELDKCQERINAARDNSDGWHEMWLTADKELTRLRIENAKLQAMLDKKH